MTRSLESYLDLIAPEHSGLSASEGWRRQVLRRALGAAAASTAPADRWANLREAVRLNFGVLRSLPADSLAGAEPTFASRFGLTATEDPSGISLSVPPFDAFSESLPPELGQVLALDPDPRRPAQSACPDGALMRLSSHARYQTPTQKSAVRALLTMPPGTSLLVSMSTGSGKSLMFQLGVRWWREQAEREMPCALVVVPTVALALDHVEGLRTMPGLEACAAVTGAMSGAELQDVLMAFERGEVPLLFLSPEMAFGRAREVLERMAGPLEARTTSVSRGRIVGVFIDEAHIIESWGKTFRPDFQRLASLLNRLRVLNPQLRTVLLSATIGREAAAVLRSQYAGTGPYLEVMAGAPRTEFDLVLQRLPGDEAKRQALSDVLNRLPRPAIVYGNTRPEVGRFFDDARAAGYKRIALFTGDTEDGDRLRIVRQWRANEIDLVFATSAFGMGVNKVDVRAVVHVGFPEDAARYYQEVGRGGRDGHQALALCFWSPHDVGDALGMALGQTLTSEVATERWEALFDARVDRGLQTIDGRLGLLLDLPLSVGPARLGTVRGGHNKDWNRSLLTMMQRADAVRIVEVPRPDAPQLAETWTVLVDPDLAGPAAADRLAAIFAHRDDEETRIRENVLGYLAILTEPRRDCIWARIFERVEARPPLAPECGRCPPCRARGATAPALLEFLGLDKVWPGCEPASLTRVLQPEGRLEDRWADIVAGLARQGFAQFVVPDGWGERAARRLADVGAGPGLVLEVGTFAKDRAWHLADLSTAFVAEPGEHARTSVGTAALGLVARARGPRNAPLMVLADPGWRVDGRPFEQIASPSAALTERDWAALLEESIQ